MRDPERLENDAIRAMTMVSALGPDSHGRPAPVDTVEVESQEFADSCGLLEYWQMLYRRKGFLLLAALLGVLVGGVATIVDTPVYQASTSLEVMIPNEDSLSLKGITSTEGSADHYVESFLRTQVQILQSESLQERVLSKHSFRKAPTQPADRLASWRQALRRLKLAAGPPHHELFVRVLPDSRIVEVQCNSPDRHVAADFANALANEYIDQGLEMRFSGTERTRYWLTRQLDDLKVKLEKSEEQLQANGRESGLMYVSEKESVTEDKLKQLQQELARAQAERIARQSQYEIAVTNPIDTLPQVLDSGRLSQYQSSLTDLRRQLAELSNSLTPAHYRVKRIEAQIAEVEATLKRESANIVSRVRNEYESASRREKLLSLAYSRQAAEASQEAAKAIQYNILKREVDTNRQLYESILQKVKEAGIVSAMKASNVRIVDAAKTPLKPYKPNWIVNAALGLFSGLLLGAAFVFVRERTDHSIRAPGDVTLHLGVPELGTIPASTLPSGKNRNGRRQVIISLRAAPQESEEGDPGSKNGNLVELVTWGHKRSLAAESFRAAVTSILLSGQNGSRPRVIVLTSPGGSEGKTTTVSNLGIALAEINRRVLVIDADMRKPRLHTIFDVPNSWGLSDLLRDRNPIETSPLEALARETEIPGLSLLTSGPASVSISNLLYSPRMNELLDRFRREFDTVLIDTPPMLHLADARVLGGLADAVILVVSAGQTTRDSARAARQRLMADGIRVLGTILNRWDPKRSSSQYYGPYYYPSAGANRD